MAPEAARTAWTLFFIRQCKATQVKLVAQTGWAELQRERDRLREKYVLGVRLRKTDWQRGREPEGGRGRRGEVEGYLLRNFKVQAVTYIIWPFTSHKPHHHIIVPVCCTSQPLSGEKEKSAFEENEILWKKERTGRGQNLVSDSVSHLSRPGLLFHSIFPRSISFYLSSSDGGKEKMP